jgi:uncharacterized protein YndB with AHSA1/START domain
VSLELRFERLIAAPPERVFDAFTRPDGQREFYGTDAPGWADGSSFDTSMAFTFAPHDSGTLMTLVHAGFPDEVLRDEHTRGLPNAFDRFERMLD